MALNLVQRRPPVFSNPAAMRSSPHERLIIASEESFLIRRKFDVTLPVFFRKLIGRFITTLKVGKSERL